MKKFVLVILVVLVVVVAGAIYLQRSERPGEPEGEGVGEVAAPGEQPAPEEAALESAGEVTHLIPEAWAERQQAALELAVESPVYWQEEVWTEDAARLRLALTDGSVLNLGSNVHLKIVEHELKSARSEFLLTFGQLRAEVTYQPEKRFEVRTNTAVIGVMGTQFYVEALAEMTIVICLEGMVRVRNVRDDIAGEVVLRAGEKSVVYKDRPPTPAEPVPLEEIVEVAAETSATLPAPTEQAEDLTRPSAPLSAPAPPTDAEGARQFAIAGVEHPRVVTIGGAREDLSVWWSGRPRFPVRMIYRPVAGRPQPPGHRTVEKVFQAEANPLVFQDALFAYGYPDEVYLDYEVLLRDADGNETEPVPAPFRAIPPR
jgi:hypothetical protein